MLWVPGSPWVKYEGLECPAGGAASALASAGLGRGCRERGQNEGTHTQVFAWGVCISFACAVHTAGLLSRPFQYIGCTCACMRSRSVVSNSLQPHGL